MRFFSSPKNKPGIISIGPLAYTFCCGCNQSGVEVAKAALELKIY